MNASIYSLSPSFAQHMVLKFIHIFTCVSNLFHLLSIPLYECTIVGLSIHLLMNIWIVSSLELL